MATNIYVSYINSISTTNNKAQLALRMLELPIAAARQAREETPLPNTMSHLR